MTVIALLLEQQQYYYVYLYGQIALAIARAITDHTRISIKRILITALIVLRCV